MNKVPLVSVVIPAYNARQYISNTLDSLLCQTLPPMEIVIVDDGSSDGTAKYCESYLTGKTSFKVITQSNGGVSAARNRGIKESQGKYILFLDADDWIEPDCIGQLQGTAELFGSDMAFCEYRMVDEYRQVLREYRESYSACEGDPLSGERVLDLVLNRSISIWTGSAIYKKGVLEQNNISYTIGCIHGEDIEFLGKYLAHAQNISHVPISLSNYVIRQGSANHSASYVKKCSILALQRLADYLAECGVDKSICRTIHTKWIPNNAVDLLAQLAIKGNNTEFYRLLKSSEIQSVLRNAHRFMGSVTKKRAIALVLWRLIPSVGLWYYRIKGRKSMYSQT